MTVGSVGGGRWVIVSMRAKVLGIKVEMGEVRD